MRTEQESMKQWRQEALLVVLKRQPGLSAGQLAEAFLIACMGEGVPQQVWAETSPAAVAGVLRQLNSAGRVKQTDIQRNRRAGRDEPCWSVVDPASIPDELPPFGPQPRPKEGLPRGERTPLTTPALVPAIGREAPRAGMPQEIRSAIDTLVGMHLRHLRELESLEKHLREQFGLDPLP